MRGVVSFVESFFWAMVWIVVALIVFVFLSQWFESNQVPVLGNVFSWAQGRAGLEQ
jgi:hypothetical protein